MIGINQPHDQLIIDTKKYIPLELLVNKLYNANPVLYHDGNGKMDEDWKDTIKSTLSNTQKIIREEHIILNYTTHYINHMHHTKKGFLEGLKNEYNIITERILYLYRKDKHKSSLTIAPYTSIITSKSLDQKYYIHKIPHMVYVKREFIDEFTYMFLFQQESFKDCQNIFYVEYDKIEISNNQLLTKIIDILSTTKMEIKETSNILQGMKFIAPNFEKVINSLYERVPTEVF